MLLCGHKGAHCPKNQTGYDIRSDMFTYICPINNISYDTKL